MQNLECEFKFPKLDIFLKVKPDSTNIKSYTYDTLVKYI